MLDTPTNTKARTANITIIMSKRAKRNLRQLETAYAFTFGMTSKMSPKGARLHFLNIQRASLLLFTSIQACVIIKGPRRISPSRKPSALVHPFLPATSLKRIIFEVFGNSPRSISEIVLIWYSCLWCVNLQVQEDWPFSGSWECFLIIMPGVLI